MKPVKSLNLLNESNHARQFSLVYRSIQQRISADPRWVNPSKNSDLSAVVFDASNRIIMEPSQVYATSIKRASRGKEGFESPMILLGTPYGVLAIHYVTEVKFSGMDNTLAALMNPCTIHATDNLLAATARFIERNQTIFADLPKVVTGAVGAKWNAAKREGALLGFLKYWALTESFFVDLALQADLDHVDGIDVSDGMPKPNFELKRTVKSERRENKRPVESGKDRRQQDRRTKPATPRNSNYTEMTAHSTRHELKPGPRGSVTPVAPGEMKPAGNNTPKRPRGVNKTMGHIDEQGHTESAA